MQGGQRQEKLQFQLESNIKEAKGQSRWDLIILLREECCGKEMKAKRSWRRSKKGLFSFLKERWEWIVSWEMATWVSCPRTRQPFSAGKVNSCRYSDSSGSFWEMTAVVRGSVFCVLRRGLRWRSSYRRTSLLTKSHTVQLSSSDTLGRPACPCCSNNCLQELLTVK